MKANVLLRYLEQFRHLRLGEPNRLILKPYVNPGLSILALVDQYAWIFETTGAPPFFSGQPCQVSALIIRALYV